MKLKVFREMSSSFFLKPGAAAKINKKRKIAIVKNKKTKNAKNASASATAPKKQHRTKVNDEEILSDDDNYEDEVGGKVRPLTFSSDEEEESPQDKRLRLAKEYLSEIERQEAERAEDNELNQHVEQRLHTEYLDSVGKLRRNIAASLTTCTTERIFRHRIHHASICALALSSDGKYLFAGAKSQYILKWCTSTGQLLGKSDVLPHREEAQTDKKRRSHIIAICLSSDMKYMALAEGGSHIQIWCPATLTHMKTLKGHRDSVTGLVFRKGSHELYSAAKDRSVKIWTLDEMAYVESLFGHQAGVTSIDALSRERAISAGGLDCSLRIWKITEESQLIYNGHRDSIECVKFINDEHFISGGVDGAISLWSALKKKALCTTDLAHGLAENGTANLITAIGVVVNTDLVATGSCDGYVRIWQSSPNIRKLKQINSIAIEGFINALTFNSNGTKLYVAVGQEHRLGRWWRQKPAKNCIVVINVNLQSVDGAPI